MVSALYFAPIMFCAVLFAAHAGGTFYFKASTGLETLTVQTANQLSVSLCMCMCFFFFSFLFSLF